MQRNCYINSMSIIINFARRLVQVGVKKKIWFQQSNDKVIN